MYGERYCRPRRPAKNDHCSCQDYQETEKPRRSERGRRCQYRIGVAGTVSRWIAGKALPDPQTQLVISDLRYVVDRLSEFYTPDETRLWLYSKHRLLNGKRAIDLINQGDADKVLTALKSIDEASCT